MAFYRRLFPFITVYSKYKYINMKEDIMPTYRFPGHWKDGGEAVLHSY